MYPMFRNLRHWIFKIMDNTENKDIKENKWKKHIPFYILELLVLLVVIIGAVFVYKVTRAQKVNLDLSKIGFNLPGAEDEEALEEATEEETVVEEVKEKEVLANNDYIQENVAPTDMAEDEDIDKEAISSELYKKYDGRFEIAFFGVDSREGDLGAGTRSDSMIICSIDMDTHEVKLVSIYRDTYLNLGNDAYNKCNSAYALGGPEQALTMMNKNLDLYLDQYITIGFEGLIDAIDALGGVPIDVKENEIFHLNNYQMAMAEELGETYTPVIYAGTQMLNGLQATAYCRIRYTSGDDFKRAERQRDVIAAMLKRTSSVSVSSMTSAVTNIMPNVATSLSLNDIVSMLSVASDYKVTVSDGMPFEGMRNGGVIGSKGSCVVPTDLTKNVKRLHKILYDDASYEPSANVKKYAAKIKADTQDFLMY